MCAKVLIDCEVESTEEVRSSVASGRIASVQIKSLLKDNFCEEI